MAVPPELVWLVERLRSTPSKRERVRLLLQGREVVRTMSPQDRLVVARELGFDRAEKLVEVIADRGGFSSGPWLKMLDEVEQDGGEEAVGVVRGLLDPATRGASLSRLIDAASGWVADLDSYRSHPTPDSDGDIEGVESQALDNGAEPGAEGDDAGELPDGWWDESPGPPVPPVKAIDPEPRGEAVAPPTPPPPPIQAEHFRSSSAEPAVAGDEAGFGEDVVAPEPPVEVATEEAAAAVTVDRVMAELGTRANSSARLAVLRGALGGLAGADAETLEKVLAGFPEGWARRRALETLYRGGLPESLDSALELMGLLTRESERMWALTTLAATRELSPTDADALISTAGSPALVRRLAHRVQQRT